MIRRFAPALLTLAAVTFLPLTSCAPERQTWEAGVFRFNNGTEVPHLDPALMTDSASFEMALQLFEGLLSPHPQTLEPLPGVAESWEVSDDGLVYTFHLRESHWSNGDPVTSRDFVYAWKRVLTPATTSSYAYQLFYLENAEAYYNQDNPDWESERVTDWDQVGVKALDDHTLEVTLHSPCPYFLHIARFQTLMPVHRATVEAHGDRWTRPEHMVNNGPFLLKSHRINDRIILERNPLYYDANTVLLDEVHAYAIEDQNTAWQKYMAGELDEVAVPLPLIDVAKQRDDYTSEDMLATYFYRFNVTRKPFDDARVRQALNLCVEREAICEEILKAGQKPATTIVPPVLEEYESPQGLGYDAERARRLLAEAGYPNGEGWPEVTLLYNTSEAHKTIALRVTRHWEEELGIRVTLENKEWKVFLEDLDNLNYDIARASWIGDYPDPNTFLNMWVTDGGNNRTGWSHERYDALIEQANLETDAQRRLALLREAEEILCVEELPIIPVYTYRVVRLLRPHVQGWYNNFQAHHPLKYVSIEPPLDLASGRTE